MIAARLDILAPLFSLEDDLFGESLLLEIADGVVVLRAADGAERAGVRK